MCVCVCVCELVFVYFWVHEPVTQHTNGFIKKSGFTEYDPIFFMLDMAMKWLIRLTKSISDECPILTCFRNRCVSD